MKSPPKRLTLGQIAQRERLRAAILRAEKHHPIAELRRALGLPDGRPGVAIYARFKSSLGIPERYIADMTTWLTQAGYLDTPPPPTAAAEAIEPYPDPDLDCAAIAQELEAVATLLRSPHHDADAKAEVFARAIFGFHRLLQAALAAPAQPQHGPRR